MCMYGSVLHTERSPAWADLPLSVKKQKVKAADAA
jgi:hypothetical protein